MGTITLNLRDDIEKKFRKAVGIIFGNGKGNLGKAANLALDNWAGQQIRGNEARMLELLEKGFKMGKLKYSSRDELHER